MKIRWLSTEDVGQNVKIELYKQGLLNRIITSSTLNDGIYNWIIPPDQMTGADYQIKITSLSNTSVYDFSNSYFTIEESPQSSFGRFFIPEGPDKYFAEALDHAEFNVGNELGGNFTVEAWYYEQRDVESMEGYPPTESRYIVIKPGSFYLDSYKTKINNTDMDCIGYEIKCNGGYGFAPGYICERSYQSTREIWHHVALIADNGNIRLYIDGKLGASGTTSGCFPMNKTNENLIVGDWAKVDEVRISDIARYSGTNFIPPAEPFTCDGNTRALWHFDEPNGATEFHDVCGVDNTLYKGGIPLDTDHDGLPDAWEIANGLDPNDDGSINPDNGPTGDPDSDGFTNLKEYQNNTNPNNPDTDGDGLKDGEEYVRGTNPLVADTDGDGFSDFAEVQAGTDPLDINSFPCTDNDSDGYGNPGSALCPNGSATDCNDNNPSVNPGMTEIAGNGKDDDCNPATLISLMGEMNNDDLIDISDVILVLRMALKIDPVQPCSDLNNDGVVDISDVILTLRMALKIDPLQQCN
jgi:hypothetical protein